MKIILATNNEHKVREIKQILGDRFDEIVTLREANICHETEEDGEDFISNALKKAREITEITGEIALADDSGICVDALGGAPGIYSARYASTDGENASDKANRDKLLEELKDVKDMADRSAYFACAVAVTFPDGREVTAEGRFYGQIAFAEAGENGFGYDSLFYVPEKNKTSAQMSEEEKNGLSHRGKALRLLAEKL